MHALKLEVKLPLALYLLSIATVLIRLDVEHGLQHFGQDLTLVVLVDARIIPEC
jgi:hypothetical protein